MEVLFKDASANQKSLSYSGSFCNIQYVCIGFKKSLLFGASKSIIRNLNW